MNHPTSQPPWAHAHRLSQVLLAPWHQRSRSEPWGRYLLLALVAALTAASLVWLPHPARGWAASVVMLGGCFGCCMALAFSLQEQNHPHAARFVPGHLRILRQSALLAWLLFTLVTTLILVTAWPGPAPWALLLLSCGAVTCLVFWAARHAGLWLCVVLLFLLAEPIRALVMQLLSELGPHRLEVARAASPWWLPLGLALEGGLVMQAFANGQSAHQARYARQALMRLATQADAVGSESTFTAALGRPYQWLVRPYLRALQAWQQHLLRSADNTKLRSVMARASLVLHGAQHWLRRTLFLLLMAVLGTIALFITTHAAGLAAARILDLSAVGIAIGLGSTGLGAAMAYDKVLWDTRHEQALLRLLPGLPQGGALNRALLQLHVRLFVAAWLGVTVALWGLSAHTGRWELMCLALAALPVAAHRLTVVWAAMRAPSNWLQMWPMCAYIALGLMLFIGIRDLGWRWDLTTGAVMLASVAIWWWRWPRSQQAAAALPVGRLAG